MAATLADPAKERAYQEWKARQSGASVPRDFSGETQRMFDQNKQQMLDQTAAADAERAPVMADVGRLASEVDTLASKPVNSVPLPENTAKHLDPKQLSEAASVWMTLGAFAGLLTRQPMTAALNNMTAAMKGAQEGDMEQYNRAYDEFDANFKKAMAANKQMLDEREKVLKDTNLSLTAKESQLRLIDTRNGAKSQELQRSFKDRMSALDAQWKMTTQSEDAHARLSERHQEFLLAEQRHREVMAQKAQEAAAAKSIPEQTVDFYARQSLSGDNSWQVGLARGKVGQALIAAVKDRIPQLAKESNMSPQDVNVVKAQRESMQKALNQQQAFLGAAERFIGQFKNQSKIVEKYLDPGVAGQTPAFNRWIQAGRKALAGDADVTNLDTAIRGLAREHQRIVTGATSNAQLHVSAQQTADELVNVAMSPEQIRGQLKVMRDEAETAIETGKAEVGVITESIRSLGPHKAEASGSLTAAEQAELAALKAKHGRQ
jgi:type II secretory pathway pseudopilin PulG